MLEGMTDLKTGCLTKCIDNVLEGTAIPCRPIESPTCDTKAMLLRYTDGTLTDPGIPCSEPCINNIVGGKMNNSTGKMEGGIACHPTTYIRYVTTE